MKTASFFVTLALLVALPLAAFAEPYNKDVVVTAMRANQARIGGIKTAVANKDFFAAGQAFFDYAKEASDMLKMDPPKGSKDDWARVWSSFQDKAFLGIGACGERDAAKVLKALDDLVAVNKIGHPEFRF
ncbi:MAG: hypothetical protein NT061_12410 [Spirochaetes bacterium]|nr:hypothetical protein [Spirochaetota bacterium]